MSDFAASSSAAPTRGLPLRLLSDERLARLVAMGQERAFAVLYDRHHQALYRFSRAIVRHEQDAQDVLQTTMARALAALSRGVPDAPIRPWLFRIAHNEAVSTVRRRRPTIDLDQAPEPPGRPLEARLEERSRLAMLVADLNALPERQRGALVMRELSGLSHEEIAVALGVSVSGAKQAIFDARTGLQEFAKGRAMHCADVQRIVSERDGRMLRGRPLRAHLRTCEACRGMRDAIAGRRSDLAALAPPLSPAAASGVLASIFGGGSGAGAGGLTSVVAGKIATTALTGKLIAGAAVVATVAVGGSQVVHHGASHARGAGADSSRPAASAGATPATPGVATAVTVATPGRSHVSVRPTTASGSAAQRNPSAGAGGRSVAAASAGSRRPAAPGVRRSTEHRRGTASRASHARRGAPPASRRARGPRRAAPATPARGRPSPRIGRLGPRARRPVPKTTPARPDPATAHDGAAAAPPPGASSAAATPAAVRPAPAVTPPATPVGEAAPAAAKSNGR